MSVLLSPGKNYYCLLTEYDFSFEIWSGIFNYVIVILKYKLLIKKYYFSFDKEDTNFFLNNVEHLYTYSYKKQRDIKSKFKRKLKFINYTYMRNKKN